MTMRLLDMMSVGPVGFNPTTIAGCKLWLRADKGTTIATGVSVWADQSGNGNDVSQAVGAEQPTLNASDAAYNNQKTLTCVRGGGNQWLQSGALVLAQPFTVFVVGNDDGTASNETFFDGSAGGTCVVDTNDGYNVGIYAGSSLDSGVARSSAPRIIVGEFNGGSSKVYVSALTAGGSGAAGANGIAVVTVGATHSGAGALNGKLAEVLIYNSILSLGNRTKVMNYLGPRYGITVGA